MRKLMILCGLLMSLCVSAQTATKDYGFLGNTFVGVHGGLTMPVDMNGVFPLNSGTGIELGKWVSPVLGFNVEGDAVFGGNHYVSSSTFVRSSVVGLNAMFNLSNAVNFKQYRKFSIIPEVGLNWIHSYGYVSNDLGAKTGVRLGFLLGKSFSLYGEPVMYWNLSDGGKVRFDKSSSQLGLKVGLVYRFRNSDGTHDFTRYDIGALNGEINSLRDELSKKPKEVVKEVIKEVSVVDTVMMRSAVVFFAKDSSEIVDTSSLDELGTGIEVDVHGYASPEGTDEYNMSLSQRRANAVANYLRLRGVNVGNVIAHGADGETSNRVVLVY